MAEPDRNIGVGPWAREYSILLSQSGLDQESVVNEALQPSVCARSGLFSLAQCLEQPSLLLNQVAIDYSDNAGSQAVRAFLSVLQQDLALSVIAPLTLRLFRDGQAPLPDANRIFLAPADEQTQTASRWFRVPGGERVDEENFVRSAGELTAQWYPVFRRQLGVSPGAYWSSIGLGLGAPFSVVWNRAEPQALCQLAQSWLGQFQNDANRFIDWIPAVFGKQATAIPQRRGCCLKYLLPDGGYCGTCGVHRKERLAALIRQGRTTTPGQWQPGQ
ncbi:Ferric iron reductase protein FhuF, involved in iron transport [Marinobacter sp. es.048]|uniref:(2Fe-2S)-binding protein n=1 Tax=Marinobacter sp. es.048 TaxID=1761795 RepID=UPI000B5983F8|nr:(2Fe-2S)-binding protein [Marinobacter sp. es.048]SNC76030.1 Ferric iron reductase protein FhuF, involved in iron transport [Marinobacter sp. es.048]